MGSSGKTRTTFAKLNRESKLRDKRAEKQARKVARKLETDGASGDLAHHPEWLDTASPDPDLGVPEDPEGARGSGVSSLPDEGI